MAHTFDPGAAASKDSGVFGLPHSVDEARVVLIPVPFEATCSYGGGTSDGPGAVLSASRQVDLYDVETGRPYEAGIAMLSEPVEVRAWNDEAKRAAEPVIEAGGVLTTDALKAAAAKVNALSEKMNAWVHQTAKTHLARGKLVGLVGGDHSVSYGSILAHAERYPQLGVLHVDAHADLRLAFEGFTWSHASIMRNVVDRIPGVVNLVQVGLRDMSEEEADVASRSDARIIQHYDSALAGALHDGIPWRTIVERIISPLPEHVYISFDIDGLDPALCPGTGTPVPGGLSFREALTLFRVLARSGRKIVGFDLTEVAPGPDGDEWDANVGARVLYKMIGWALRTQR
ncbi:MAG: agmatinase family protein [Myxococcota bacterium]